MSLFTNAVGAAPDERRAYVSSVLALVGDEDPIDVLSRLTERIDELIGGLSDEALRRPESPGKWSIVHVIRHLADAELVWAFRLRMVLAHDEPELAGFDQDLWASRLGYDTTDLPDVIEQLTVLRKANLRLLRDLPASALQRTAVHRERGRETLAQMLRLYAGHDLVHVRQLDRLVGRWAKS